MLNDCTFYGRLTHDPELRTTGTGTSVCSFSIACERDYRPEGGERETDFIDCVAWRHTAEFISKYFRKGSAIIVRGRLQIRKWTDEAGNNRRSAEIAADDAYFCGEKRKDGEIATSQQAAPRNDGGYMDLADRYPGLVQVGEGEPF